MQRPEARRAPCSRSVPAPRRQLVAQLRARRECGFTQPSESSAVPNPHASAWTPSFFRELDGTSARRHASPGRLRPGSMLVSSRTARASRNGPGQPSFQERGPRCHETDPAPDPSPVGPRGAGVLATAFLLVGMQAKIDRQKILTLTQEEKGHPRPHEPDPARRRVRGDCETIRISAANLQIVNGQGATDTANCVGNLIVGYNELRGASDDRTGSHMIVAGRQNNYSSFGASSTARPTTPPAHSRRSRAATSTRPVRSTRS